jgi:hypothetical protein
MALRKWAWPRTEKQNHENTKEGKKKKKKEGQIRLTRGPCLFSKGHMRIASLEDWR